MNITRFVEMVRDFAQKEIAPKSAAVDREARFPAEERSKH